jgi:hypothetical protein
MKVTFEIFVVCVCVCDSKKNINSKKRKKIFTKKNKLKKKQNEKLISNYINKSLLGLMRKKFFFLFNNRISRIDYE